MNFEYKQEYKYFTNACINITDDCNLACKYCFVEQNPHYISLDTAKQCVDFLINNLNNKKKLQIIKDNEKCLLNFFGGEPLLLFNEIIVPLVEYCENKYPNQISLGITTNGTLLNEEKIKWFRQHNVNILLSIDGIEETQNYNRPCKDGTNSFDKIIINIPTLLNYFPNTTFRSTIYEDTCNSLFENYIFATMLGFKNFFTIPDTRSNKWLETNVNNLKDNIHKIFLFVRDCFKNNIMPPMHFSALNKSFETILRRDIYVQTHKKNSYNAIPHSAIRCGIGTGMASFSYNGEIYACQEQDSKNTNKNFFYIGNIYNGIDIEKHSKIIKEYITPQKVHPYNGTCDDCLLEGFCIEPCPSASKERFNDFFACSDIECVWEQTFFYESLNLMYELVEENNKTFEEFLNKYCNYSTYFNKKEENNGK